MATIQELRSAVNNPADAADKAAGRIVVDDFDDALQNLIDKGLAVRNGSNVDITPKGALFFEEERAQEGRPMTDTDLFATARAVTQEAGMKK